VGEDSRPQARFSARRYYDVAKARSTAYSAGLYRGWRIEHRFMGARTSSNTSARSEFCDCCVLRLTVGEERSLIARSFSRHAGLGLAAYFAGASSKL
jgi:hypothetical protein